VREVIKHFSTQRRQGAGKTGELLCVSAALVSPKSGEGGWRLGVKICRGMGGTAFLTLPIRARKLHDIGELRLETFLG
jgi:hypothetical protein